MTGGFDGGNTKEEKGGGGREKGESIYADKDMYCTSEKRKKKERERETVGRM